MNKPYVSVIVPVYNTASYLSKCLNSLVNQTLPELEIIIVNDGSTDGSQRIIDEYVEKYPNLIKSFWKRNSGVSDTRNYGIERSSGEYIGFVDSDDWVAYDMYYRLYSLAKSCSYDIVCTSCVNIYSNHQIKVNGFTYKDLGKYGFDVILCNKIVKSSFIEKYNFRFVPGICLEDKELFLRMLTNTNDVGYVDDYMYFYNRMNTNSQMNIESRYPVFQKKIILNLELWRKQHKVLDEGYEYKLMYEVCMYLWFHETDPNAGIDIFREFKWRIIFNKRLRCTFKIKAILMLISPKLVKLVMSR